MPGHQWAESEYTLQKVVELFRNLLFELEEQGSTHIYHVVFRFAQLEGINYLVVRYLSTVLLPFEEFSEKWLYDWEV